MKLRRQICSLLLATAFPLFGFGDDKPHPNVLFILADDLGWSDTTLYGTTDFYQTPNLERLRRQGRLFTNAHTASSICSPTRASIMTGNYPARFGITQARGHVPEISLNAEIDLDPQSTDRSVQLISATRLPTDAITIAEAYRSAGYETLYFGKWHLGNEEFGPLHQGFGNALPSDANGMIDRSYFSPWGLSPESKAELPAPEGEHADDRMTEEIIAYLEQRSTDDAPFFLFYGAFSIHSPWSAKPEIVSRYSDIAKTRHFSDQNNPVYAAMVETHDQQVGRILDTLIDLGLNDDTIIVYSSDNGGNTWAPPRTEPEGFAHIPGTSNHPLRAGKGSIYEGGTRVPLIFSWPANVPANSTSDALFGSNDFFATLLSLCNLPIPDGAARDSIDQKLALLANKTPRDEWITYYPHFTRYMDIGPVIAIQQDGWKLVRRFYDHPDQSDIYELYHLSTDISEASNQVNRWPQRVTQLKGRLDSFLTDIGQPIPYPNPQYLSGTQ